MVDASKAIDQIDYVKLFTLLIKKGLRHLICRILAFMYKNQCVKLRWGHCESEYVKVSNGVKQGGILSPIFFTIYIDELLITLQNSGLGCYIGNIFMAPLGYADDVILITPTVSALNICRNFVINSVLNIMCYLMLKSTSYFTTQ